MLHLTGDMWHMTHGGVWIFSQNFSSLTLTVWDRQCLEDSERVKNALSRTLYTNLSKYLFFYSRWSKVLNEIIWNFHWIGPLGRFGQVVAMSVYLFIYVYVPVPCNFLGLSLALKSHDQFQASHWSSLLPLSQLPSTLHTWIVHGWEVFD